MGKRIARIMLVLVAVAIPSLAVAYSAQSGDTVTVPKGETKTGTFYASGGVVTIDGDVNGDLICAGQTISVNGAVHGDVICAGQNVTVNGPVDGSVRVAGQTVAIHGAVGRNVTAAGQTFTLGSNGRVAGDLGVFAQAATISGPVAKDVHGGAQRLALESAVGGMDVQVEGLSVGSKAAVRGNLRYVSPQTAKIDDSKVGGEITRVEPPRHESRVNDYRHLIAVRLAWMLGMLSVGLALVWLAPRLVREVIQMMQKRPGMSIGWGLLLALVGPVLAVLLAITVIGIPLGILTIGLWALVVGLSSIFAGIAAGNWLLKHADWRRDSLVWAAVVGIPVTVLVFSIPVVGPFAALAASWWAIGGQVATIRSRLG